MSSKQTSMCMQDPYSLEVQRVLFSRLLLLLLQSIYSTLHLQTLVVSVAAAAAAEVVKGTQPVLKISMVLVLLLPRKTTLLWCRRN